MNAVDLYHHCREAGIVLGVDGDSITFDAPQGVSIPVDDLRRCKAELLAMLSGDYLGAAAALLMRVADPDRREELMVLFDERAGIVEFDGGMDRGEADKVAFIELSRAAES